MKKESRNQLSEKVVDYQKTGKGWEELHRMLALRAYFYPRKKFKWKLELCSDFLIHFYPIMLNTVHAYKDQGLSFDHYFNATMSWQLRAFLRKKRETNSLWYNTTNPDFWDLPEPDNTIQEPAYDIDLRKVLKFNEHNRIKSDREKRQFLFYALKKARSMTEANLQYIALTTGYSKDWLFGLVEKLRQSLDSNERRLRLHEKRKKTAFARILLLEQRIKQDAQQEKKAQLHKKSGRQRAIYSNACRAIARIQLSPTNEAIALATGYPKGTVDSSIVAFKNKLKRVYSI